MSVTPRDLVQLAMELRRSAQPVRRRAAVSRAYYALFHAAVNVLHDCGVRIPAGTGAHKDVRTYLLNSGDDQLRDIGSRLAIYHNLRINADYRLQQDAAENLTQVVDMVSKTKDSLDTLEACLREPRRSEILKALKP